MKNTDFLKLSQRYPFFTLCKHGEEEFIGIIENSSKNLISIYIFDNIKDEKLSIKFLELGEEWWWSSNRTIPIDIFLKSDFEIFRPYLKHFSAKELVIITGPVVSLDNIIKKRSKRKTIELIRKD